MVCLSRSIANGPLGALTTLVLQDNIGDQGMLAFSNAISSGSMANLEYLNLGGNQIGDVGMAVFSPNPYRVHAWGGSVAFFLTGNLIGDAGMIKFSEALGKGSLPVYEVICVHTNPGNAAQLKAACAVRGIQLCV